MFRVLCGNVGAPAFALYGTLCECIRQPGHVANCSCACGLSFKSEPIKVQSLSMESTQKELALA